jgi:hypothetical protein
MSPDGLGANWGRYRPSTMAPVPREEMDALLDTLFGFARQQLEKHGEFFPFAAAIDSVGEPRMVGVYLGEEHPQSAAVIEALYQSLSRAAAGGEIRAAGVCADVRVMPPRSSDTTDAISAAIEHRSAEPVDVFLPYSKGQPHGFAFGELFAQRGTSRVFVP